MEGREGMNDELAGEQAEERRGDLPQPAPAEAPPPPLTAVRSLAVTSPSVVAGKKKRGRPRKYGPDGSLVMPLSLMPISASAPAGEFTLTRGQPLTVKRGRGRHLGSAILQQQRQWGIQFDSSGNNLFE